MLGGAIVALQFGRYRWLVVDDAVERYVAFVAVLCAAIGIWLGRRSSGSRPAGGGGADAVRRDAVGAALPVDGGEPFVPDAARIAALGLTPRELEVLALIAEGLSNEEIATRAGVSVNTVKTHVSRVLGKLEARRRTQAVLRAREWRLIP